MNQPPNPIPAPIQALLDLFESTLGEVKFPELDAGVLSEAAVRVQTLAKEVAQAETTVEAARAAYQESQETLLQRAHRALAYARIYAEDSPELAAQLEGIVLGRGSRRVAKAEAVTARPDGAAEDEAPKRRGRPPKVRKVEAVVQDESESELLPPISSRLKPPLRSQTDELSDMHRANGS